jgi:hypothetical protein
MPPLRAGAIFAARTRYPREGKVPEPADIEFEDRAALLSAVLNRQKGA